MRRSPKPRLTARQARRLNDAFAFSIQHGRPFVTLKAALSVDGKLAPPPSARTATTAPSLAHGRSRSRRRTASPPQPATPSSPASAPSSPTTLPSPTAPAFPAAARSCASCSTPICAHRSTPDSSALQTTTSSSSPATAPDVNADALTRQRGVEVLRGSSPQTGRVSI